eukprot:CAMPEP_0194026906 /NCGR_PEP_ID=MMETSP0009_2-20130614/1159_1 /TAXON_ID=210454 /ORGANISM="Grammatophora oceanica, Strain CCMP 410" /LENGTH=151 /DNA_ID=CAMNT_0038665795 /DNA_START=1 /DNA_END=456 /DNA_ORIENTATION=-
MAAEVDEHNQLDLTVVADDDPVLTVADCVKSPHDPPPSKLIWMLKAKHDGRFKACLCMRGDTTDNESIGIGLEHHQTCSISTERGVKQCHSTRHIHVPRDIIWWLSVPRYLHVCDSKSLMHELDLIHFGLKRRTLVDKECPNVDRVMFEKK